MTSVSIPLLHPSKIIPTCFGVSQYVDDPLEAGGSGHSTPFYLPPMDRSPETCYVRTRGDIILAVVRKKELLECDDDADLRTLKTAARPVRIKVKRWGGRGGVVFSVVPTNVRSAFCVELG